MSKVDWSLAPEGATHYSNGNSSRSTYPAWWRPSGATNKYECWAIGTSLGCETWQKGPFNLPDAAVKREWSGPQDGLPTAGTVCEYSLGDSNCWYVCEIKYVLRNKDGVVAECHLKPSIEQYLNTYQGTECLAKFRAIKTPDQLAAEQRETAIREFMDIVGIYCRVTASKAVDAGFKREVV